MTTKWNMEMDAALVEMREAGYLYREIGARLGVTSRSARARGERLGLPPTERVTWTPALDTQITRMRETQSAGEIAESLGMTLATVESRLRYLRNGKPSRARRGRANGELAELELAPGHFAVDSMSYELIREAGKDGEKECLTTL